MAVLLTFKIYKLGRTSSLDGPIPVAKLKTSSFLVKTVVYLLVYTTVMTTRRFDNNNNNNTV